MQDPTHAANAFYDALIKIDDYRDLPITEAAQAVQRSAFPGAYADHEADARVLASALSGNSPAAFSCQLTLDDLSQETLLASGLTPRSQRVLDEVQADVRAAERWRLRAGRRDHRPHGGLGPLRRPGGRRVLRRR